MKLERILRPLIRRYLEILAEERRILKLVLRQSNNDLKLLILLGYGTWRKNFKRNIIIFCSWKNYFGSKNLGNSGCGWVIGTHDFFTCRLSCDIREIRFMGFIWRMEVSLRPRVAKKKRSPKKRIERVTKN